MTIPPPRLSTLLLPLEDGDRLTREEFERRYEAMPHVKKAELIEGVVHVPSPVRFEWHGEQHAQIETWLGVYAAMTPGVRIGDNSTIRLDKTNEPQPDVLLLIEPSRGGQARITESGYVEGAPELAVEVASSSASYDVHDKLNAYQRNGIREYVIWRVRDSELDWLVLRDGKYEPLVPDSSSLLRSTVFPGLWLDANALLRGDMAQVLAVLNQGIGSAEHQAFLA